jgi:hypothetical protein
MPTNAEKENHARSVAAAEQRTRILADVRATYSSDHGKRTLDVLRLRCGYDRPAFLPTAGSPLDPLAAAFRDGRRSIYQEILDDLATAEDKPIKLPVAIRPTDP